MTQRATVNMMTSSNGNIFRVTGPLCGEFTGPVTGEFPLQRPVMRSFDVFFDLRLNKRFANHRDVGDLRRHRAHYDVTAMNHCHMWRVLHQERNECGFRSEPYRSSTKPTLKYNQYDPGFIVNAINIRGLALFGLHSKTNDQDKGTFNIFQFIFSELV